MPGRAYIRLSTDLPDRKFDYPDGAYRAFIETLIYADGQPVRGTFRNETVLKGYLGRRARWVNYLLAHGDLVRNGESLYVDGWAEWQEGNLMVAERMRRYRQRKRESGDTVTNGVTPTVTTDVTDPVTTHAIGSSSGISKGTSSVTDKPKSFMGWKPKPLPGERAVPVHDGRDGPDCLVCFPREPTQRPARDKSTEPAKADDTWRDRQYEGRDD